MIPLTRLQKEIMMEFYGYTPQKVIFNKTERNRLWKIATARGDLDIEEIRLKCPALAHQIKKAMITDITYNQQFLVNVYMHKHSPTCLN